MKKFSLLLVLALFGGLTFAQQSNLKPSTPTNLPINTAKLKPFNNAVQPVPKGNAGAPTPMAGFPAIFDTLLIPQINISTNSCQRQFAPFGVPYADGGYYNSVNSDSFYLAQQNVFLYYSESGIMVNVPARPGYQQRLREIYLLAGDETAVVGTPDSFSVYVYSGAQQLPAPNDIFVQATARGSYKFTLPSMVDVPDFPNPDQWPFNKQIVIPADKAINIPSGMSMINIGNNSPLNASAALGGANDTLLLGFLLNDKAQATPDGVPCDGKNFWSRIRTAPNGQYYNFGAPPTSSIAVDNAAELGAGGQFQVTAPLIVPIVEYYTLEANAGNNVSIACGGSTQLQGKSNYIGSAANPVSFSWAPTTGMSGNPNSSNPTVAPTTTTTYTLTVKYGPTSAQQEVTSSVTVTVTPPAVTASAANNTLSCGGSTTLTATAGAGFTYSWAPTTGLDNPTSPTPTVSGLSVSTTYTVTATSANGQCSNTATVAINVNAPFTLDAIADQTIGCGGSATLTANANGTGMSYVWSNGQTGASISVTPSITTTYTVTATDANGCGATTTALVTVNSGFGVDVQGTLNTVCGLGVNVIAVGTGNVPTGSTFSWSSGQTGANVTLNPTETTTYTVTLSNGQCDEEKVFTITVDPLTATASGGGQINCGGSKVLDVTTNAVSATYSWAPAAGLSDANVKSPTATSGGTYTVTVSQGGCSVTSSVVITVNTNLNVSITPNNPSVACGSSTTLTATELDGATYTWTSSDPSSIVSGEGTKAITVNPAANATYTVTASANGGACSGTATVSVNVTALSVPTLGFNTAVTPTTCGEAIPVKLNNTTSNANLYDFEWTIVDGDPAVSNDVSPTINFAAAGQYQVVVVATLKSSPNCSATFQKNINVTCSDDTVSVQDPFLASAIEVYPNPNTGRFTVRFNGAENAKLQMSLFNMNGQIVTEKAATFNSANNTVEFDVTTLPAGVYNLQVKDGDRQFSTRLLKN